MVENLFDEDTRVLVKDGEFNDVQGDYHHYDYSQRITNNGCYNIIGNTIHNVSNIGRQVIYLDGRGSRSMHHGRVVSSSVTTVDASDNASSPYHNPQSQVPIQVPDNPNPLSYGYFAQSPRQYFNAQSGDVRQMSAVQSASMNNEIANVMQEINSEFSRDNEEQNTFGPDMYSDDTPEDDATRSQSLSADFNCLTIEERHGIFSSTRSAFIYGSSSTAVRADKNPKHIIIQGDHTEVDNNFYQSDFDSHKVKNNIIENSFGEGEVGGQEGHRSTNDETEVKASS